MEHEHGSEQERNEGGSEPGRDANQSRRSGQSINDWAGVYEGLTEDEVEAADRTVKTRAKVTRNLPGQGTMPR